MRRLLTSIRDRLDRFGILVSGLCVVHCLAGLLIVAGLGLDAVRFHDLRHSFVLYSLQSGDSIKEVQEALGHTTITTTMDTYGHISQKMKQASAERMNNFITSLHDKTV